MSSLLQFNGQISREKGVGLLFYRVEKGPDWEKYNGPDAYEPSPESSTFADPVEFVPETKLPILYRAWRKPRGMWGCWVMFQYNGKLRAPDLSVPISILKLPKDAKRLTDEECISYWES